MKTVIQLDESGYFTGITQADKSPLEPDVYLMPRNTIDAIGPSIPDGYRALWSGNEWSFEPDLSNVKDINPPSVEKNQIAEMGSQKVINGEWVQTWEIREKNTEELAETLAAERAAMKCSRLQGRLVLGEDTCDALDAIATDDLTPWAMRQTIQNAIEWNRTSQAMTELGFLLGYTEEQMDDLFRLAMTVDV